MITRNGTCVLGLLLALLSPVPSLADISMFASPDGDGGFIVEGDNAQGVAAINITIGYDKDTLANPRVQAQGGTLDAVSADTPGKLTVDVIRENPDAAFELHLQFDKKGELPGVIKYITAVATDKDGRKYAPASESRALQQPMLPANEEPDADAAAEQNPDTEAATGASEMDSQQTGGNSVLQRFKEYKGRKGLKEFAVLFERSDRERMMQKPAIALSDGETSVRIQLELQHHGTDPPNIALTDAKLVALRKSGENMWEVTALPVKGTWEASLIVISGGEPVEFPLVVAPTVMISYGINEKSFLAALDTYHTGQTAKQKGERVRYRDEYIFTANYLAGRNH